MRTKNDKVVVTGIGPISSSGIGKDDFWGGLCRGATNIKRVQIALDKKQWKRFIKHKIDNFDIKDFDLDQQLLNSLSNWKEDEVDEDLMHLLAAVSLALKDSGLLYDYDDNEIGLIVTHENPGLEQYFSRILDLSVNFLRNGNRNYSKKTYYEFMIKRMMKSSFELQTFMPLHHIAKFFRLHGYTLFINNACASGAYAFEEARRFIQSGLCDVVILVAADFPGIYKYLWFNSLNMYSNEGISRPFCSNSKGFIMGDGATGIVLESLKHANKRKAKIYAEYLGGACLSESWKVTLPNINLKIYEKVIKKAINITKIKENCIDLVIPHGVGLPLSDKYEDMSLKNVFKNDYTKLLCTALKPYFGHNLGGNVLLEVAALMMMFEKRTVLPTLNIDRKNLFTKLNFAPVLIRKKIDYALKITCAFAGFDSALIFKKHE